MNTLSWAIRQANVNPGADSVILKANVTVTGVMKRLIDGAPSGGDHDSGGGDLTIQSDATRRSISGGNTFRPLFVKSGTVTIQNVDLINGKAKGGDGSGGGAGLGGALFVYNGAVTVRNVAFSNNNATGGSGSGSSSLGGGGMFGNGSAGGGGLFGDSIGNDGGFGGGGGYGAMTGGSGGFGGGGGYGAMTGGNGGFGGGGGYGVFGGGGSGFGGAIFAMKGSVTLSDVSFSGNTVTAGSGFNSGSAAGGDIYICTAAQDALCGATVTACGSTLAGSVGGGGTLAVPVCGCGLDLPASTWVMTAPACQPADPPGASVSAQYGPGIPGGGAAYGSSWIGYTWNAGTPGYSAMPANGPLALGQGNWLYSSDSGAVSMAGGTATPVIEDCAPGGIAGPCYAIDLAIPPAGASRWNFVGHPFPYAVSWADVKVATYDGINAVPYSPSAAEAAGYVSKTFYSWNGNTYLSYEDSGPQPGVLGAQKAFWVRSLAGSSGLAGLKLLIPAR